MVRAELQLLARHNRRHHCCCQQCGYNRDLGEYLMRPSIEADLLCGVGSGDTYPGDPSITLLEQ
jgi:hypothetical protein